MIIRRIWRAWREHGTFGLTRRLLFRKCPLYVSLVYCKTEATSDCAIPGLTVERFTSAAALDSSTKREIDASAGEGGLGGAYRLFKTGCHLWIGRLNGRVVGTCWSRKHHRRSVYVVRLNETDAVILSCFVPPEFRGRGIFPAMLEKMVRVMMDEDGTARVFIDCRAWNAASSRGIQKARFTFLGKAVRLVLFNRMVLFDRMWGVLDHCK